LAGYSSPVITAPFSMVMVTIGFVMSDISSIPFF
jgi:hypothetical protein